MSPASRQSSRRIAAPSFATTRPKPGGCLGSRWWPRTTKQAGQHPRSQLAPELRNGGLRRQRHHPDRPGRRDPRLQAIDSPLIKADYRYTGFGRLALPPEAGPALIKTAFAAPLRDALGRTLADRRFRYTYTAQGQVESVRDRAGQPIATYRYNSLGQRVAKTVHGVTTYTLWQAGNRVAEIDGDGNIQTQYLYLAEGQRSTPIAKLAGEQTYYIHADHRGAPLAMTDAQQAIVWRANVSAWGAAQTTGPASLNLRLPGQYYDEETGLHDNWHRTYDPSTGRYLQPDPLGYPDGTDAYLYVAGDPVNRVDTTGLYATDVHYYLTYFLALAAGLTEQQAWFIATADEYTDSNPNTDAIPTLLSWPPLSTGGQWDARADYHFTQMSTSWDPNNDQIKRLNGYAMNASATCLKLQFYGEYMHAFQDTFGHRDNADVPYGVAAGHMFAGTHPDRTYNHSVGDWYWNTNEARTLRMEEAVFNQLKDDWGTSSSVSFESLREFLDEWNKIEEDGELSQSSEKRKMLDSFLKEHGLPALKSYDANRGQGCRFQSLRDAQLINANGTATTTAESDYPGTIFKTPTGGPACKMPGI